jgi:hypothetical protein
MEKRDHTKFITASTLIGIVVTVTVGIFATVYANDKNLERDKFYAEHCKSVSSKTTSYDITMTTYTCGGQ